MTRTDERAQRQPGSGAVRETLPPEYAPRLARLTAGLQTLDDKPEENASSTLCALWWLASGRRVSAVVASTLRPPALPDEGLERLDTLIDRRLSGEPLAHITARQWFSGLEMIVSPAALVPRRETELLADVGIELTRATVSKKGRAIVADACTGCGNVALAIAARVPQAEVLGADLSTESVALANANARHLGLQDRVTFTVGDLLAPFVPYADEIDVLTCNPPYISTAKVGEMATEISDHEPPLAFDGGPLGVNLLLRLIETAPGIVAEGGWVVFEVGRGQGPGILRRLKRAGGYSDIRGVENPDGDIRVVQARVDSEQHRQDEETCRSAARPCADAEQPCKSHRTVQKP